MTGLAGGAAVGGARALGGGALGAVRSGTAMGSAASAAYQLGRETEATPTVGAGLAGVARAASNTAKSRIGGALGTGEAAAARRQAAWHASHQHSPSPGSGGGAPRAAEGATDTRTVHTRRHHPPDPNPTQPP